MNKDKNTDKKDENKNTCACGGDCCQVNDTEQQCECGSCDTEESCDCGECGCDNDSSELIAELENNWKRALADYKNLQKRVIDERENDLRFLKASILMRLIPVLDNLEMMALHSDDQGLKLTIKDFLRILQEEGVTTIEAENKDFDARTMEAVEMVDGKENKVMEVTQKGYTLDNLVLRPARVKVGKAVKEA